MPATDIAIDIAIAIAIDIDIAGIFFLLTCTLYRFPSGHGFQSVLWYAQRPL